MHRAQVAFALTFGVAVSGCGAEPPGNPTIDANGVDGGEANDADTASSGLELRFSTDPETGASFVDDGAEVTIKSIDLRLADVRVIGDAAPGDERTTVDSLRLEWGEGVRSVSFDEAPPGLYSSLRGSIVDFELEGDVIIQDGGEEFSFEAERESGGPILFELSLGNLRLEAGDNVDFDVVFEIDHALDDVKWDELEVEGDKAHIEGDDLESVVDKIDDALRPGDDGGDGPG